MFLRRISKKILYLNGHAQVYSAASTAWFSVLPGINEVKPIANMNTEGTVNLHFLFPFRFRSLSIKFNELKSRPLT